MIEVVIVTPGGEASETIACGDPAALVGAIDRLAAAATSTTIVEWFVRPAKGYRWG